ncbi:MAG TPA: hypothetical protein VMK12_23415 [Anaeromyxobacteraceae bacterium]|nr:hypothetical protein [Anaeromyxobacteraceae bacterium]
MTTLFEGLRRADAPERVAVGNGEPHPARRFALLPDAARRKSGFALGYGKLALRASSVSSRSFSAPCTLPRGV